MHNLVFSTWAIHFSQKIDRSGLWAVIECNRFEPLVNPRITL